MLRALIYQMYNRNSNLVHRWIQMLLKIRKLEVVKQELSHLNNQKDSI